MSNDQHPKPNLITPLILHVSIEDDQIATSLKFINTQLNWDIEVNSPRLIVLNKEQAVISIETIRNLITELAYAPHLGQSRVFLLLSAEQLSDAAQHAFLKSLEEPPVNTLVILITTNPNQLLPTIKSRCILKSLQQPTTINQIHDLPSTMKNLFIHPEKITYSQLIEQANDIKDKEQALQLSQQALVMIRQSELKTALKIKIQQQLLKTLNHLHKNANLKLALESCFFNIKNALSE